MAVEITNFRSGLACTNTAIAEQGAGWICQPTKDVLITDQGDCIYDNKEILCTWFGFEFDYENDQGSTTLLCSNETSVPTDSGNPREIVAEDTTTDEYALELDGKSGHFFNPQYFAFEVRGKDNPVIGMRGVCRSDGALVFEYRFNLKFPIAP